MNLLFRLGILVACLLAPSIAAADDSGWYVGFDWGRTTASNAPGGLTYADSFGITIPYGDPALKTSRTASLRSTSKQVEGGYWINDYAGLQVGYLDMGTYSNAFHAHDPHKNICYGCGIPSDNTTDFSDTNKSRVRGLLFALIGRVPLGDFELLGKAGLFFGTQTSDEHVTGLRLTGTDFGGSADYSADYLGVGLGWRFASHWGVELWRDVYKNTNQQYYGNSSLTADKQFDVKGYSLSIQYRF